MDASKTEVLSSESRAIPSRRIVVNDPGQLPMDYSTTPGGTIFSTTPGGKFVRCFGCFNAELSKITLWRPITNWMPQVFNYSLRLWVCFELIDTSIFNCVVGNLWTCNCNASVLVYWDLAQSVWEIWLFCRPRCGERWEFFLSLSIRVCSVNH